MARKSIAPVQQIVQATPVVEVAPVAPVNITVAGENEAQRFARLSSTAFNQLTRDDKAFLTDYDRKQSKALDGAYETIAIDPTDAGRLQLDIRCIAINGNTKRTGDGRPYLFSLDGFEFSHLGREWSVGAFYAVEKKAKAK